MRAAHLAVVALLVLTACGGGEDEATVFAAASLTEAFSELDGATFSFAGSSALVAQIEEGAPADVLATADERTMDSLVDAGLVRAPSVFATNVLAIAVAPGNPEGIDALADLSSNDLLVVLVDPSVPAGAYTEQVLTRAAVDVRARSYELDVKAALAKVTSGEADATVVYASDLRGADADGFVLPPEQNVTARYPIAVVVGGDEVAGARFIERVRSERGQAVLRRHGFLPPP